MLSVTVCVEVDVAAASVDDLELCVPEGRIAFCLHGVGITLNRSVVLLDLQSAPDRSIEDFELIAVSSEGNSRIIIIYSECETDDTVSKSGF